MSGSSRVSMISSAAALIGAHGLSGTSFSDVLADSGAPRGSIYHHFPGGKRQLAGDVIEWTSGQILGYMRACPADTAEGVLAWFVDLWRQSVLASGGCGGCPVAGVAMDADDEELTAAARAAFASWTALLAEQLAGDGRAGGPGGPDRRGRAHRDGRRAGHVPGRAQQRAAGDRRGRARASAAGRRVTTGSAC